MSPRRKLGVLAIAAIAVALAAASPAAAQSSPASKKAAARTQLDHADNLRSNLESQPQKDRTKREYETTVAAYRHIVATAPATAEAQTALTAEAGLYEEMGRAFDQRYFLKAVDAYQLLLKEYPGSRYRSEAMFAIARIQQDDLDHPEDAQASYDSFLSKYPHSAKAADAQEALKEIAAGRERAARTAAAPGQANQKTATAEEHPREGHACRVNAIRQWNADNYTRVVISLEDEVKYQAARIANPDRIYLDLYTAHLSAALAGKPVDIQSGFLKSVRVAQNQVGVVRVVLEVEKVRDYSVFLLKDPYRLVVDVYGDSPSTTARAVAPPPAPDAKPEKSDKAGQAPDKTSTAAARSAKAGDASTKKGATGPEQASAGSDAASPATPKAAGSKTAASGDQPAKTDASTVAAKTQKNSAKPAAGTSNSRTEVADNQPSSGDNADTPAEASHTAGTTKGRPASDAAETASVPQPTHRGERSLTRTLGLKIGKIVIDAGHGGHDTGTIGPTGLEEKDLTLDVALRLGKLIEQKLGAEVVYTRSDDTFIPLEERTAIANQAKADLFVSIHANSSNDPSARGIETFYLNLTDSPEAREVAARENALSQASIHDLQDLVQKIARNEKIDESRELATEVQLGLAKRMQRASHPQKNRGVKRAPFVVLLGANMPSVLTEISFISNPSDEAALKKGEQRQHVAEGILAGISHYLESIGSGPHATALLATHSGGGDR